MRISFIVRLDLDTETYPLHRMNHCEREDIAKWMERTLGAIDGVEAARVKWTPTLQEAHHDGKPL